MASKKQNSAEVKIHVAGLTKDFGENHVLRGIDIDIDSRAGVAEIALGIAGDWGLFADGGGARAASRARGCGNAAAVGEGVAGVTSYDIPE